MGNTIAAEEYIPRCPFTVSGLTHEGLRLLDIGVYPQAFEYLLKAANQGHGIAEYYAGMMYRKGQGVSKDYHDARYWLKRAGKRNTIMTAKAYIALGEMYMDGHGVEINYHTALKWFKKAGEKGDGQACGCVGILCISLEEVLDKQEAVDWFTKGARLGCQPLNKFIKKLNEEGYFAKI